MVIISAFLNLLLAKILGFDVSLSSPLDWGYFIEKGRVVAIIRSDGRTRGINFDNFKIVTERRKILGVGGATATFA